MSNVTTATSNQPISVEQEIARLRAENEALKASGLKVKKERHALGQGLSCAIGEKGGISIYGLNVKFPVTLYGSQLTKLISVIPELMKFMQANQARLATKPTVVK